MRLHNNCTITTKLFSFQDTKRQRNALIKADLKLIFVPLIFLLLRVWSFVIDIPAFYMPEEIWLKMRSTWTAAILSLLSVSPNHWSSQRLYVINSALCLGSQNLQKWSGKSVVSFPGLPAVQFKQSKTGQQEGLGTRLENLIVRVNITHV